MIAIIGIPASNICVAVVCRKWGAPHFRHAYATHCYENGLDLLSLKSRLGHRSINSTAIYVHLAASDSNTVINPFDQLGGSRHV